MPGEPVLLGGRHNGVGVTALTVGGVGVVLGAIPIIGLKTRAFGSLGKVLGLIPILGILAIVCGIVALTFGAFGVYHAGQDPAVRFSLPIIGLIFAFGAALLGVWSVVVVNDKISQWQDDWKNLGVVLNSGVPPAVLQPALPTTTYAQPLPPGTGLVTPPLASPTFPPLATPIPPPAPTFAPLSYPPLPPTVTPPRESFVIPSSPPGPYPMTSMSLPPPSPAPTS